MSGAASFEGTFSDGTLREVHRNNRRANASLGSTQGQQDGEYAHGGGFGGFYCYTLRT